VAGIVHHLRYFDFLALAADNGGERRKRERGEWREAEGVMAPLMHRYFCIRFLLSLH